MRHLKMLGFVVMIVAVCMAFAGGASANPRLTSPPGTEFTGSIHETLTGSWLIKIGSGNVTCTEATRNWKIETNDTIVAGGAISSTTYSKCNGTVDVLKSGSIRVGSGGSVSGSGSEVTVALLGTSCVYGTAAGTTLGTLTSGGPAKMTESASLPKISGGFACANPASVTGAWFITSPSTLHRH
jgi:hypothetical protein